MSSYTLSSWLTLDAPFYISRKLFCSSHLKHVFMCWAATEIDMALKIIFRGKCNRIELKWINGITKIFHNELLGGLHKSSTALIVNMFQLNTWQQVCACTGVLFLCFIQLIFQKKLNYVFGVLLAGLLKASLCSLQL